MGGLVLHEHDADVTRVRQVSEVRSRMEPDKLRGIEPLAPWVPVRVVEIVGTLC